MISHSRKRYLEIFEIIKNCTNKIFVNVVEKNGKNFN